MPESKSGALPLGDAPVAGLSLAASFAGCNRLSRNLFCDHQTHGNDGKWPRTTDGLECGALESLKLCG
jgi:hypothetical protein